MKLETKKKNYKSIEDLEKNQDDRLLNDDEWIQLLSHNKELHDIYNNAIKWAQRTKERWIKLGDANTKYFHRVASANYKKNIIPRLIINGIEIVDQESIREHIFKYYKDQFGKGGITWGKLS